MSVSRAAAEITRAGRQHQLIPVLRTGVLSAASPLTVLIGGDTTAVAAVSLGSYMPAAADVVQVLDVPGSVPLILGSTQSARVGCRIRRAAAQTVTTNTTTSIQWDTEVEDTHGFIAVTSPTVTIPAGKAGLYAVTFEVNAVANAGRNYLEIVPASSLAGHPTTYRNTIDEDEDRGTVAIVVPLAAADTLTMNILTQGTNVAGASLSCFRMGP